MQRLRVLIVDDERRISKLIEKLINWDENNLEFAGSCDDGLQAYEAISANKPDIVITDIRMPILDGLELIKRVHELGLSDVRFVVISGYREFEYAHTALKYGVEDYLLKPVNEKELNDALRRLNASFNSDRQRKETASLEAERKLELMGKQAVDYLSENQWNGTIDQFNAEYGLDLQDSLFTGLNVKFDHRDPREADQKQDSLVTRNAVQLLSGQLRNLAQGQIYSIRAGMDVVALVNSAKGSESKIHQTLQESFAKLKDYVYAFSEYEVTMALGPTGTFPSAHGSLLAASDGVYERIVFGTGKIILSEDLGNRKELSPLEDILPAVRLNVANAVQSFSATQLAGHIDSAFALVRDRRFFNADAYYETAIAIARQVYGQNAISIEERLLTDEVHACWSLATLVSLLKDRLCAKLAALKAAQQTRSNKPIRAAISFVEEHYPERIGLEDVASTLALNPTYFSTLFKKETGMNFLTYLTEFRVEKAKDLLCTTNDTMACIAERVGYADTRYFSQCFEKIVGVKPSLYRKMYS